MADLITERSQFEEALLALLSNYSGGTGGEIPVARLTVIDLVKAKLDELIPGVDLVLSEDEGLIEPYTVLINSLLDESAKRVLQTAPIHILTPKLSTAEAVQNASDNKIGYIVLPADFLRIALLKMTEWKREVTDFITPADGKYKLQHNRYTRGGLAKPVAVLTYKQVAGESKRVVEYYSVNSSHVVEHLYYIPETLAEDIQTNLQDALTWTCAGMILQVTERGDLAKFAFEQANACYQNL